MRLLFVLEGTSMSSNLSSHQLRYVSIIASLLLGLKEDLGLNLSVEKVRSSFLKCQTRRSLPPYYSNSLFNIVRSILLVDGTNFPCVVNMSHGLMTLCLKTPRNFSHLLKTLWRYILPLHCSYVFDRPPSLCFRCIYFYYIFFKVIIDAKNNSST